MSSRRNKPAKRSPGVARSPVIWGILATVGFYAAVHTGHLEHPLVLRYFANHPVEYIATTMFFVGLAALLIKLLELANQPDTPVDKLVGAIPSTGQDVADAPILLERIDKLSPNLKDSYLCRRVRHALQYLVRTGSADGMEDELRRLADADAGRSYNGYALVRIIVSTIPILGFLGTVIGITRAVAELAQLVGEISFDEAINSVVSGLSVAFDTTALALALSIVLMFAMFFISRLETARMATVESAAAEVLVGRFRIVDDRQDPNVAVIRQMTEEVVTATESLVQRQAEIWSSTMHASEQRWNTAAVTIEKQLETALSRALQTGIRAHGEQLQLAEKAAHERTGEYWHTAVESLEKNAAALSQQHEAFQRQADLLQQVVEATARVTKLEDALNRNLGALRQSHHFDQTVSSLAAAVSLLNTNLGRLATEESRIELQDRTQTDRAA